MQGQESIIERLIQYQVEFVIIGGFAAVAHGATMMTEDLDICAPLDFTNLTKIQDSLKGLNPVHRLTPQKLPFNLSELDFNSIQNIYLDTDYGVIDLLSNVKGLGDYNEIFHRSIILKLDVGECPVLNLDDLITAKRAVNTAKDKMTILQLRAIKEKLK